MTDALPAPKKSFEQELNPALLLRLIMDNIPQSVFWKDRQSVYIWCNQTFATNAGVPTPEYIVGKTDYDFPWTQEEAEFFIKIDQQVMNTDTPAYQVIERQMQASGKHAWVVTNKMPLHDAEGNVIGVLGTYEDITERKLAEEALQRAYDELEIRVKERTAELSSANEQLKQEIEERKRAQEAQLRSQLAEHEQRTLAEALRDIAALLNSTLNLDEVLDRILAEIGQVVPHDTANIILIEDNMARVVRDRSRVDVISPREDLERRFSLDELPNLYQMLQSKHPLIIEDTHLIADWVSRPGTGWVRSYLGTPVQIDGEVIGFINLNSAAPGFFNSIHADRLRAFANQAATAIRNASLYKRAQALAAMEERQRLARELHDAVSQTLWTACLLADVLPSLWAEDLAEGERTLEKLRRLTRGALAEMRTLLLELRPATLVETNLGDLLRQLTQAVMSRKKVDIALAVSGESRLPPDVQISLYRIAQEVLNNIAKHSRASQVAIQLDYQPNQLFLHIRDNGRGFNLEQHAPGGLGLDIMRERAEKINAHLQIDSKIDGGTTVTIIWPNRKEFLYG